MSLHLLKKIGALVTAFTLSACGKAPHEDRAVPRGGVTEIVENTTVVTDGIVRISTGDAKTPDEAAENVTRGVETVRKASNVFMTLLRLGAGEDPGKLLEEQEKKSSAPDAGARKP